MRSSVCSRTTKPSARSWSDVAASAVLLSSLLWLAASCASAPSTPCPYSGSLAPCPVCRVRSELAALGEMVVIPSLRRPPHAGRVPLWRGAELPVEPPGPETYVRCRPCSCNSTRGRLEPWDEWHEINRRAYARLRESEAPYPVAIVPGFHGGGIIARYRLEIALRLLRNGWVASLIVSGGHRRGGDNEAAYLWRRALLRGTQMGIDMRERVFVEPCACRTVTNLRNSLRMMAAFGIRHGLLVTESKVSGQSAVFSYDLDSLVRRELRCPVGRVSLLLGSTALLRIGPLGNGCRAPLGFRHNPATYALPRREPAIFWVSPFTPMRGGDLDALRCIGGSPHIRACEPDDQSPFTSACLPVLGHADLACRVAR